jgi:ABC-2 type transport system permease protein
VRRGIIELKQFFRQRDAVVFTFTLPAIMLLLLGSIFGDQFEGTVVTASQMFTAGMIAAGVASTTFVNLGIGIAVDRDDGTIKRLLGTPMPRMGYMMGKLVLVLVLTLAEIAILLAVGIILFGLELPTDPMRWFTFVWVFGLGVTGCSLLGIAASSLPRTARSAPAVMNLPYLVLSFISGVFVVPLKQLPEPLIQIASVFPLKWMAQGFRSVFLPDVMRGQEVAGSWEHGRTALVLAAWCVGGLVLCLGTFRWRSRQSG